MTARNGSGPRFRRAVLPLMALAALAFGACEAAAATPIVYTAPPDILARTYPPADSPAPADSAAPQASSGRQESDAPDDSFPTVLGETAAPTATGSDNQGHPQKGVILFGTAEGTDGCSVANPTDTLTSTQTFYFIAYLSDVMDGTKPVTLKILREGATVVSRDEPPNGSPFDCFGNRQPLAALPAGAYEFQVLLGTRVEADGKITVT